MPAKAMLFDAKCTPIYDFGSSAKNFVRYNPLGNLICLAGFGNLAGNIVSGSWLRFPLSLAPGPHCFSLLIGAVESRKAE